MDRYVGQLAHVELDALTRLQVMDWFHGIAKTDGPYAANLALHQLHSVYERAQDWELYDGRNPTDRIKQFPTRSRTRFVQSHEMPYLLASIHEELPRTEVYFLTLLFTGCRRDEARTMQWTHLDLEGALWHKPTTKTGRPHTMPLPAQVVSRLRELPRINQWVFPSTPNGRNRHTAGLWCVTSVESAWRKIRKRAGLLDVRIHDLRRTAASWLAIDGANLPVISRMLGHASWQSTQVYARLSIAPVRQALDQQAERMLGTLAPAIQPESWQEWPGD